MSSPDFEAAKQYVLDRLIHELPAQLLYHNVAHTMDDVLPAAERLAEREGLRGRPLMLLRTAALFHDIGFVQQRDGHEALSSAIAREVLPRFGYGPAAIDAVAETILATRLPQNPQNLLGELLADADLDVLGRDDLMARNQALRDELAASGLATSDEAWYRGQLAFVQGHRYFTEAAYTLRDAGKARNVARLAALLAQSAPNNGHLGIEPRLHHVGLFAALSGAALRQVAALFQPLEAPAGLVLFHKGEPGDCLYVVERGRLRVFDGERLLNELHPGDLFGEMALLDAAPRVATVIAAEHSHLLRLEASAFGALLSSHPEVGSGLIRVLCGWLRARLHDMAEDYLYLQQMALLTSAATMLEEGQFEPERLAPVAARPDSLGQLARVFQRMGGQVVARQQRLRSEAEFLRIEIDEARGAREVAAITESDYFQRLQQRARRLRDERPPPESAP